MRGGIRANYPRLPGACHAAAGGPNLNYLSTFSVLVKAGLGRHFPDRREPIALRSPCFAQALGDHCAAHSVLRASPGRPSLLGPRDACVPPLGLREKRPVFHAPENACPIPPSSSFSGCSPIPW